MSSDPVIDTRTEEQIIDQAQALRSVYTPEWTASGDDRGLALISVFARLMEIVISRLNRVPEKNFLAFLETTGAHLLPPNAARVPARFIAATGAKRDGVVPMGTQLATTPPPGQEALTFETEAGLNVSRSRLAYLFSHDPDADQYADQQATIAWNEKNENRTFQPFIGTALIPHRLHVSQDTLFQIDHRTELTLVFKLESMTSDFAEFFKQGLAWKIQSSGEKDITPPQTNVTPDFGAKTITVVLDSPLLTAIDKTTQGGTEGYWLLLETKNALSRDAAKLKMQSVTVASSASDIKPALAFFNLTPLDTNREFYLFGEKPKTFDTFFLSVPEAFGKTGSRITLQPAYLKGSKGSAGVELTYEFWNGSFWETLGVMNDSGTLAGTVNDTYHFTDTTKAFTADSGIDIQFDCPAIKPADVNGKNNVWIRARITNGNYGEDAKMTLKSTHSDPPTLADWLYDAADFKPPIITKLTVSYEYTVGQPVTACKTENNFSQRTIDLNGAFQPFAAPEEEQPACYLGFDSPFSPNAVSMYVAVEENVSTTEPLVVWEYWDGTRWKNLGVRDATRNFTESGMVEFIGPSDAAQQDLFQATAFWVRARLEQGDKAALRIQGMYLNTVWAKNCVTITNEMLGSSTETPLETFTLSRYPVLDGLRIEVLEPELPSEEELNDLRAEEGSDAVSPAQQGEGESRECWVRWHRVDDFRLSGKKSRHYIVDWFSGTVQFGDNARGMVPPAGNGNIRARWYQAGGGAKGNVGKNSVTVLKRAIPFVDKTFNVDQAGGGSDGEAVEHVKVRGPQTIKNRDRAVTWEDYEWLAREASFQVARARCLPAKTRDDAGRVRLILVPWSDDPKPAPSQGLIRQVRDYVSTRARRIATADLVIAAPQYVEVSISANIFPEKPDEADLVRRRVKSALTEFFHPLRGGPEGNGWEFGRDVFVSEVSKVIEDTDGVHHAEDVEICSSFYDDGVAAITMPPDRDLTRLIYRVDVGDEYLVASGEHAIAVLGIRERNLTAPFLGNSATKELHNLKNVKTNCRIGNIRRDHRREFLCLSQPIRERYDFCAWCFGAGLSLH